MATDPRFRSPDRWPGNHRAKKRRQERLKEERSSEQKIQLDVYAERMQYHVRRQRLLRLAEACPGGRLEHALKALFGAIVDEPVTDDIGFYMRAVEGIDPKRVT